MWLLKTTAEGGALRYKSPYSGLQSAIVKQKELYGKKLLLMVARRLYCASVNSFLPSVIRRQPILFVFQTAYYVVKRRRLWIQIMQFIIDSLWPGATLSSTVLALVVMCLSFDINCITEQVDRHRMSGQYCSSRKIISWDMPD